jgi:hypothetical protein
VRRARPCAGEADDLRRAKIVNNGIGLDIIGKKGAELKPFHEGRFGDLVSDNAGGLKASTPF